MRLPPLLRYAAYATTRHFFDAFMPPRCLFAADAFADAECFDDTLLYAPEMLRF